MSGIQAPFTSGLELNRQLGAHSKKKRFSRDFIRTPELVLNMFLSADVLDLCLTVTSLVAASYGSRWAAPAPPGSGVHFEVLNPPGPGSHSEVPAAPCPKRRGCPSRNWPLLGRPRLSEKLRYPKHANATSISPYMEAAGR
jgi:hypothetical protein